MQGLLLGLLGFGLFVVKPVLLNRKIFRCDFHVGCVLSGRNSFDKLYLRGDEVVRDLDHDVLLEISTAVVSGELQCHATVELEHPELDHTAAQLNHKSLRLDRLYVTQLMAEARSFDLRVRQRLHPKPEEELLDLLLRLQSLFLDFIRLGTLGRDIVGCIKAARILIIDYPAENPVHE